jgi:hypothetical protein
MHLRAKTAVYKIVLRDWYTLMSSSIKKWELFFHFSIKMVKIQFLFFKVWEQEILGNSLRPALEVGGWRTGTSAHNWNKREEFLPFFPSNTNRVSCLVLR